MVGASVNRPAAMRREWFLTWSSNSTIFPRKIYDFGLRIEGSEILGGLMRNRAVGLVLLLVGVFLLSLPAAAQVFYPGSVDQKKAAEGAKVPQYDLHDLS